MQCLVSHIFRVVSCWLSWPQSAVVVTWWRYCCSRLSQLYVDTLYLPKGGYCSIKVIACHIAVTALRDADHGIRWLEKHHAMRVTMDIEYYANSVMCRADFTFGIDWAARDVFYESPHRFQKLRLISKSFTWTVKFSDFACNIWNHLIPLTNT